jgi:type VI secretion system secreted protein Hcp
MFLKLGSIKGDSKVKGHEDEIEVLGWSWGAHQSGTMHRGSGGGSGKVSVQDITINKWVDQATPNLWKLVCNGKHEAEGLLTIRKAGGDDPVEYLKIEMKEVLVSDLQTGSAEGDENVTETATLNMGEFKVIYTPQEADGSAGATAEAGFNIRTNEVV